MTTQLIECVPNFSEGNNPDIIKQITSAIESVEGVRLLDVDPGKATNRTVVTFVGEPDAVIEAAFRGIKKASEVIDMQKHKGEHPRMGATDVCPLIPISGISMEETAAYAQKLALRVGTELSIPVYLYEFAQNKDYRKNLAIIRAGEYEGFFKKIQEPEWQPDFGPAKMHPSAGATVIGARNFLIAYNVNLNTQSVRLANSVAFDIRENGRIKREGHPITGKPLLDENGNEVRIPGSLKECKAIGWYIDEYKIAQVSINLTNYKVTNIHTCFDECCKRADARGMRVTGSELVGLIPLEALLEAGRHYLKKQERSLGLSEKEIIHIAIKSLGLDELAPFDPEKKIIEYLLRDTNSQPLANMSLLAFANETASESPAPGGGSISAYCGALGAALGTMVANLSAGKRGWEDKLNMFSSMAAQGQLIKDELLKLVDEDTSAFNKVMQAFGLPKSSDVEKAVRNKAIEDANTYAAKVPLKVMEIAHSAFPLLQKMAEVGNPNSVSDAGVGALCLKTAIDGAYLNVKINAKGLKNKETADDLIKRAEKIAKEAQNECKAILDLIDLNM